MRLLSVILVLLISYSANAKTCFGVIESAFSPFKTNAANYEELIESLFVKDQSIEIGPYKLPICKDCIPVDRFRSSAEYAYAVEVERNPSVAHFPYEKWLDEHPKLKLKIEEDHQTWVVNHENGVVADARHLPYQDESLKLVVMNGFPWSDIKNSSMAIEDEIHTSYRLSVFKELKRVLDKDGVVMIIGGEAEKAQLGKFAQALGFKVYDQHLDITILNRKNVTGYILRK